MKRINIVLLLLLTSNIALCQLNLLKKEVTYPVGAGGNTHYKKVIRLTDGNYLFGGESPVGVVSHDDEDNQTIFDGYDLDGVLMKANDSLNPTWNVTNGTWSGIPDPCCGGSFKLDSVVGIAQNNAGDVLMVLWSPDLAFAYTLVSYNLATGSMNYFQAEQSPVAVSGIVRDTSLDAIIMYGGNTLWKLDMFPTLAIRDWTSPSSAGTFKAGITVASNSYLFGGDNGSNSFIMMVNSSGNTVWTKEYHTSNAITIKALFPVSGGYLITGTYNQDIYLQKVDLNGNTVFSNSYNLAGSEVPTAITMKGGQLFISGNSGADAFLYILDNNGSLLSAKKYSNLHLHDICQNDGSINTLTFAGDKGGAALIMRSDLSGNAAGCFETTISPSISALVITDILPTYTLTPFQDFQGGYFGNPIPNPSVNVTTDCIQPGCQGPVATITSNGPTTFCDTDSLLISATTGIGYSYQWQLNGNNINGAINSDHLVFTTGNYTCVVTTACGSATSNSIAVTVNITPAQPGPVTSISQACNPVNNVPLSISAVLGATSYHWYAINPTITFNGPVDGLTASANLLPSTNSGYNIWVEAINNGCVSQPRVKFIRRSLSVPASVIGSTQVCVPQTGVGYSCAAITAADDYLWSVPAGVSITSGQGTNAIVVSFAGNYTTGSICVSARLNCGFATTPKCKTVSSFGNSIGTINNLSGPTYLCAGSTYNYSVSNISGATFNWSVPANVTITSGQGTNTITVNVLPGFSSGSVCVYASNSCSTSLSKCMGVATSTPARPSGIAGVLNGVCASVQSYSSSAVAGATGYNWTVTGGTILTGQGTQTISVQWNNTGASGILGVAAINGCGAGLVRTVGTTLKPEVATAISGPATLCAGSFNNVFSIPAANGASTYTWQITPSGSTIVSGQGTTSINATWGSSSGTVLCTPANVCGTSKTKTFAVTVNCRIGNDELANGASSMELTAYPNPFNDEINIQLKSNDDKTANIKITDISGRILAEQSINANTNYAVGKYLPAGIYFVASKQNNTVKTICVVKNQ